MCNCKRTCSEMDILTWFEMLTGGLTNHQKQCHGNDEY